MRTKRIWIGGAAALVALLSGATASVAAAQVKPPGVVLYKSALCGCCGKWATHLRAAGFRVVSRDVGGLLAVEARYGVPQGLGSCHTAVVGGYVVVGHVPADVLERLLRERPAIAGLSVPGMPGGAPGMEAAGRGAYEVVAFDRAGRTTVYAKAVMRGTGVGGGSGSWCWKCIRGGSSGDAAKRRAWNNAFAC